MGTGQQRIQGSDARSGPSIRQGAGAGEVHAGRGEVGQPQMGHAQRVEGGGGRRPPRGVADGQAQGELGVAEGRVGLQPVGAGGRRRADEQQEAGAESATGEGAGMTDVHRASTRGRRGGSVGGPRRPAY